MGTVLFDSLLVPGDGVMGPFWLTLVISRRFLGWIISDSRDFYIYETKHAQDIENVQSQKVWCLIFLYIALKLVSGYGNSHIG